MTTNQTAEDEIAVAEKNAAGVPPEGDGTERGPRGWLALFAVRRISAAYLWLFFMVLFGILSGDTFLTSTTYRLVFSSGVVTCIIALAFLVPLACGQFDLSVGAVMGLALSLMVYMQDHTSIPPGLMAVFVIVLCAFVGSVSGFIVVRLHVNSFIATLGVSQILLAAVLLISDNTQLLAAFPKSWSYIGNEDFLGIPIVMYFLLAIALVVWYVLEFTRSGRYLFATGGNEDAARLAGVKTDKVKWVALIASAAIAGMAGVIYSMRIGIFTPAVGPGYLFPAIAAVFLGASQLSQRPNVWGTLLAYFALAFGIQGILLTFSGAAVWSQPLFQGVSLIIAVALAARPAAKKLKKARGAHVDADAAPVAEAASGAKAG